MLAALNLLIEPSNPPMSTPLHVLRRCLLLLGLSLSALVQAQDARHVTEPVLPPACAVLTANRADGAQDGRGDDSVRIQAAIDRCAPNQGVQLSAGGGNHAFVAGPLILRSGVALLIDRGVTLYAGTDPMAYDRGSRTCGSNDAAGNGCKPFISVANAVGSGIMGDGVIDGQGGQAIAGTAESWWQLARRAQREHSRQNIPRLIQIDHAREFILYRVTLRNAPNFHVAINRTDGFTAWGIKIDTPADARNTDGIDPAASRNITIAYSFIRTGDDNVAIKAGNGGPTENVSILHNHFYSGHGMSIGSETNGGVRRVLVDDLTLEGTTSGLRIKSDVSRGGLVQDVLYRNICLRDVKTLWRHRS
jgi:polygalacturonase